MVTRTARQPDAIDIIALPRCHPLVNGPSWCLARQNAPHSNYLRYNWDPNNSKNYSREICRKLMSCTILTDKKSSLLSLTLE